MRSLVQWDVALLSSWREALSRGAFRYHLDGMETRRTCGQYGFLLLVRCRALLQFVLFSRCLSKLRMRFAASYPCARVSTTIRFFRAEKPEEV